MPPQVSGMSIAPQVPCGAQLQFKSPGDRCTQTQVAIRGRNSQPSEILDEPVTLSIARHVDDAAVPEVGHAGAEHLRLPGGSARSGSAHKTAIHLSASFAECGSPSGVDRSSLPRQNRAEVAAAVVPLGLSERMACVMSPPPVNHLVDANGNREDQHVVLAGRDVDAIGIA